MENTSNVKILDCVTLYNFDDKPEFERQTYPTENITVEKNSDKKDEFEEETICSCPNSHPNQLSQPSSEPKEREICSTSFDLIKPRSNSIWTTPKYSRSQRDIRKREKLQSNQTVMTDFISVLKKIDHVINQNENTRENISQLFQQSIINCRNTDEEPVVNSDTTNNFLNILLKAASSNKVSSYKNTYNDDLKKFCLYLFYCAGKLCYETLHANLNGILPSLSTLARFKSRNKIILEEGQFNFEGLKNFLDQRNLPKTVWLSEDATRINSKVFSSSKEWYSRYRSFYS